MNSMLEINQHQKALLDNLLKLHQLCPEIVHKKIKQYDLSLIFILSHHNKSFAKICQHIDLTSHWSDALENLSISVSEIVNKEAIFNSLMGFYLLDKFYQKALYDIPLYHQDVSIVDDYLINHNQHPLYLQRRCIIQLNLLRQDLRTSSVNLDDIPSYVEFALSIAKKYLTPGYLETALLLLEIACFLLKQQNQESEESKVHAKFAFQMFYEHTYLAQLLEDTEEGSKAIKKFYGERDIFEVNKNKYTDFSFTSYYDLRFAVKQQYNVSQNLIDIAKLQAEIKAKDIKNGFIRLEHISKPSLIKI